MIASILVVEDYADLRSAIAHTLATGHYSCDAAMNADDAIVHLKEHRYAAILLSPSLPLNEDPVMHFLVENQPEELQKVILMTDAVREDFPTLVKPFGKAQLLAKMPSA